MFKLNQSATFWWPIEAHIPVDGGRFEKATFDGEFKRRSTTELRELQDREGMTDDAFIREVLVGWRGVQDDGQDVPFSATALDQMLQVPGVAAAIVTAFYGALAGAKKKP